MLFHRCFRNRFSSPFHLDTLNISIQNIKCPESPKNTNIIMLPSVSLFRDPHPGISLIRGPYKNQHKCIQLFQLYIFLRLCDAIYTANWTTLALEQNSCKDDTVQVSQKMVGENMMSRLLQGILYSEWVCSKCSDSVWARNSDSETPVKKHYRTSGTDLS